MAALAITAANVFASAQATIRREYTRATAAQTAGMTVYLNANNQWALLDSDAAVAGNGPADLVGVTLDGGGIGQPASVCVQDPDFTPGATLANGLAIYGSATPGGMTQADIPTTAAFPVFLGIAKSTTKMNLRPLATGVVI